jgi:hypothetical protein
MMFDEDIGLDCCFEGIRGQRIPTSFVRLLVSGQILVCEYPDVVSLVVRMKDCIHAVGGGKCCERHAENVCDDVGLSSPIRGGAGISNRCPSSHHIRRHH